MRSSLLILALLFALSTRAEDLPSPRYGTRLESLLGGTFRAAKPSGVLSYSISYRFLFMNLLQIGKGKVLVTEGFWCDVKNNREVPAALVQMSFDTLEDRSIRPKPRVALHRQILALLTMPELDTILYAKDVDEHVHPLFSEGKDNRYVEIYDFRSGTFAFRREDYLLGTIQTNLIGTTQLASQGKEIATTLQLMADVYAGRRPMLTLDDNERIYVNINGVVTPFIVTTRTEDCPFPAIAHRVPGMRVDVPPAPDAEGRGREVNLWVVSFLDAAKAVNNPELMELAEDAPDWNMVPLVADYPLGVGAARGELVGLEVMPFGDERDPRDSAD